MALKIISTRSSSEGERPQALDTSLRLYSPGNKPNSNEHPVVNFFNRNEQGIQIKIKGKLRTVNGSYRDTLTLENVMNQVFLKTADIPQEQLTDKVIAHTVNNVIIGRGSDYRTEQFKSRVKLVSQMGKDDQEEDSLKFILEDPGLRLQTERVESEPAWLEVSRARLSNIEDTLTASQREFLEFIRNGLSKEEIAELSGKEIGNIRRALELIEGRLKRNVANYPTQNSGTSQRRWNRLTSEQRLIIDLHLSGFGQQTILEAANIQSRRGLSERLQSTRTKLNISPQRMIAIRRKNMLSLRSARDQIQNTLLNFIYPEGVPSSKGSEPQVVFEEKLFIKVCRLMPFLAYNQQHALKLYIQGNRICDIASITKRSDSDIHRSLTNTKKLFRKQLTILEELNLPEDTDPVRFLRFHSESRKRAGNITSSATKNDILNSLLSFVFPDGMPNQGNKEPESDYKKRLTVTICRLFPFLTPIQQHDVKLFIKGNRNCDIATLTNRTQESVSKSLSSARRNLQSRIRAHEILQCPSGIDPLRFIRLQPQSRKVIGLFISGLTAEEISKVLKNSPLTVDVLINRGLKILKLTRKELMALRNNLPSGNSDAA